MITKEKHHDRIQGRVVDMYARHPFPAYTDKFRKTAEEMTLKMRLLGLTPEDYAGKAILDCGCGTGEFTCWYAARGNQMTAIDLSAPSLEHARRYAESYGLRNIDFRQMSVLDLEFPPDTFDLVYSYGVLHHTPDPYRGFLNMVRVTKPGGFVIVSVYNRYSRLIHRRKQSLLRWLAGEDIEARCRWGKWLFPLTARKLKKRAHDDSDAVLYDQFSIPHESAHGVGQILKWFDAAGLEYTGAFGPLRIRDHLAAVTLPEFERLETTFDGYLLSRAAARTLKVLARAAGTPPPSQAAFPRPTRLSLFAVQLAWFFLGLRFSCFSIAGQKPAVPP